MASTHDVYSPGTYDRAPIVVSPNVCRLPDRGDRVLHSPDGEMRPLRRGRSIRRKPNSEEVKGSYFHPQAYEASELEPHGSMESPLSPPPLDNDLESPMSDDSDEVTTPPDDGCGEANRLGGKPLLPDVYVTPCKDDEDDDSTVRILTPSVPKKMVKLWRRGTGRKKATPQSSSWNDGFSNGIDQGCLGGF